MTIRTSELLQGSHARSPSLHLYSSSIHVRWGRCAQLLSPVSPDGWRLHPGSSLSPNQYGIHPATHNLPLLISRIWRICKQRGVLWISFFLSLWCSSRHSHSWSCRQLQSCLPVVNKQTVLAKSRNEKYKKTKQVIRLQLALVVLGTATWIHETDCPSLFLAQKPVCTRTSSECAMAVRW